MHLRCGDGKILCWKVKFSIWTYIFFSLRLTLKFSACDDAMFIVVRIQEIDRNIIVDVIVGSLCNFFVGWRFLIFFQVEAFFLIIYGEGYSQRAKCWNHLLLNSLNMMEWVNIYLMPESHTG